MIYRRRFCFADESPSYFRTRQKYEVWRGDSSAKQKAGNIGALAQGVLTIWQGISGEVTAEECATSLAKIGFVWGAGLLGDVVGGPLAGAVLSYAAEKLLEQIDKINNIHLETPRGYENVELNLQSAFH